MAECCSTVIGSGLGRVRFGCSHAQQIVNPLYDHFFWCTSASLVFIKSNFESLIISTTKETRDPPPYEDAALPPQ